MPGTLKRTYSAPAARAKRASAASKIQKAARGRGLTAKRTTAATVRAAKRTYDIATNAVMDMREEKYFHVNGDLTAHPQAPTTGPKRVSVLSFATTSNLDPLNTATAETYCGHAILNLNMLRPYKNIAGVDEDLKPYAIEGKHVYPTSNSVSWQIDRNWANLSADTVSGPGQNALMTRLVNAFVVRCRMIRVTPKLAPGITTTIAPTDDLFLDQKGLEYSPTDAAFSYSDAEYAAVNRRKYTVLQDTKFNINQPLTTTWAEGMNSNVNLAVASLVPNPRGGSSKKMVTRHQLSAKKGGAVYYKEPNAVATSNADSGHRREYVFLHFWYQSIDGGGATGDLPDLGGTGVVPDMNVVTTHFRTESRFKEAT